MTPYIPLIEALCALVHESWIAGQRAKGRTTAQSRHGTGELMIPYNQLAEVDKDDDRRVVCAVLTGLAERPIGEVYQLMADLRDEVLLAEFRRAAQLMDPPPADLADRSVRLAAGEDGQR